jgi:predicted NUDIX family phosphoesterase
MLMHSKTCLVVPHGLVRAFFEKRLGLTDLSDVLAELSPSQAEEFVALVDKNASFRDRFGSAGVEEDETYQQVVLYALLVRRGEFFAYYRGGADSSFSEKRLAGKLSVGIGGHIDAEDGSLMASLYRELDEELAFIRAGAALTRDQQRDAIGISVAGLLKNESDMVNRVHTGMFAIVSVPDDVEVRIGDGDENGTGSFMTRLAYDAELAQGATPEPWTTLVVGSRAFARIVA